MQAVDLPGAPRRCWSGWRVQDPMERSAEDRQYRRTHICLGDIDLGARDSTSVSPGRPFPACKSHANPTITSLTSANRPSSTRDSACESKLAGILARTAVISIVGYPFPTHYITSAHCRQLFSTASCAVAKNATATPASFVGQMAEQRGVVRSYRKDRLGGTRIDTRERTLALSRFLLDSGTPFAKSSLLGYNDSRYAHVKSRGVLLKASCILFNKVIVYLTIAE
jgi:hypothetical protein